MNKKTSPSLDSYLLFRLLCIFNNPASLSQREIAKQLDCALGLVNSYLKIAVEKGWLKAKEAGRNRSNHQLTSKGNQEIRRLALQHACNLDNLFNIVFAQCRQSLQPLKDAGIERIAFCGVDGISNLIWQLLNEAEIEIAVVMDMQGVGNDFMDKEVVSLAHALLGGCYKIIIGAPARTEQLSKALMELGVNQDDIFNPFAVAGKNL